MEGDQAKLRLAMLPSLNWQQLEPGPTILPSVPVRRRFWWRVMRALRLSFQRT